MNKKHFLGLASFATVALMAFAAKDPVLMTINGKDIKLSEFEYLYNKNRQQQLEKETLDQYVDRFVVYKLKVADAEGVDTTAAFKKEFDGYRQELSKPYTEDTTVNVRLAHEAYERLKKNVLVSHIMMPLGKTEKENDAIIARLDSIRDCAINGEDFATLATRFSVDRSAKTNHGSMGYIPAGRLPYPFEYAAYTTPVGEISKPFATRFGNHIVKVFDVRDDRGEVLVQHILKLFPRTGLNDSIKGDVYAKMKTIYDRVKGGEDFDEVAKVESEDPGSSKNGGRLPQFGSGRMVPEFEKVAFELKPGEISEPFETQYGVHIIKKLEQKALEPFEARAEYIYKAIQNDERAVMAHQEKVNQLKSLYNYKENPKLQSILSTITFDSTAVDHLKGMKDLAFTYNKTSVTLGEVFADMNSGAELTVKSANAKIQDFADKAITEYYLSNLEKTDIDFKNLLNEYRDGMMLFEVSDKKVWSAPAKDPEALEQYFIGHKDNYKWDAPKFKGSLVLVKSDSIADLVKAEMQTMQGDSLILSLRKKFKSEIRIENFLASKGENPMIDALVFGGEKAPSTRKLYPVYFILNGKVIDQPETAMDVKGQVTTDYQAYLEAKWVDELRKKYPVKINEKVLKLVKE